MGGKNSGCRTAEEMERKVDLLRQITGGKPFNTRDLPDAICSQLGYNTRSGFLIFLERLAKKITRCGRQLNKVGFGEYTWISSSNGSVTELVKPVLLPYVARDLTPDEAVALDLIQEILVKSQDGAIRLTSKMVAMENDDEFLNFMEKLESVKAAAKIGANDYSVGGCVWGLVRDKFNDFYQVAQAVRSGQYEFPPEPPPSILPAEALAPPSDAKEQLVVLCQATAKELSKSRDRIRKLEEELMSARANHSEVERRHKVFCSELDKLRHPVKSSNR